MHPNAKVLFNLPDDQAWLDLLIRSVNEPIINGIGMPRFPHASVQESFIGSSDAHALQEGFNFYNYVKGYATALGMPLHANSKLLDFGCGWGRYTRLFWNDIDEAGLYGVDTDPDIIAVSRALGNPGKYDRIDPHGKLPYEDGFFDVITAYSVFSHLPEKVATHWMAELARVSKSGCVLAYTTEPRRFLDFIADIPQPSPSAWHTGLARFKSEIPKYLRDFDNGKFCYIPTSGGEHRGSEVYGDAVISESYMKKNWTKYFRIFAYIDDPDKFWQAFIVAQRP